MLSKDIEPKIKGVRKIIIKPNFISWTDDMLAITRIDAVKAVVNEFRENFGVDNFEVVESAPKMFGEETEKFFDECGYYAWAKREGIKLVDLNKTKGKATFKPQNDYSGASIKMYKHITGAKFLVSLARLKTDDSLIATLGVKNTVMGAVSWQDKPRMHGFREKGLRGWDKTAVRRKALKEKLPQMHYNMFVGAHATYPDLTIIDGVIGMEGNGPVKGDPVNSGVTVASTDATCADEIAAQIMGIDFEEMVWQQLLKEKLDVEPNVKGDPVEEDKMKFKLHADYKYQQVDREKVEELIEKYPVKLAIKSRI